jgi:hypothetical protein
MSLMDFVISPPGFGWSGWVGTPMRHDYVFPMRWMVIYEYDGVPEGALNLHFTNYLDHGHHGDPPLSGKNHDGRPGNQTWDLMISSQKCWPLDYEAGSPSWFVMTYISNVCSCDCECTSSDYCNVKGKLNKHKINSASGWFYYTDISRCTVNKAQFNCFVPVINCQSIITLINPVSQHTVTNILSPTHKYRVWLLEQGFVVDCCDLCDCWLHATKAGEFLD